MICCTVSMMVNYNNERTKFYLHVHATIIYLLQIRLYNGYGYNKIIKDLQHTQCKPVPSLTFAHTRTLYCQELYFYFNAF